MEDIISPSDKQVMVSKFLEIVAGQSADTVRQFLQVLIPILKPTGYTSADPYKIYLLLLLMPVDVTSSVLSAATAVCCFLTASVV
ncbi:uncharacterized protein LOC110709088 isoform X2 [Chenopodium quinoa]|uniref:uncharacterized protein LOC110709088 isoform X2 n=1 Tax=Chenopodium quinoa TaxID=63459 RepID=UPI000B77E786|nr:uncharacterized protein LOC110709088 isoform X2 [Chenopodium quinoa]